MKKPSILVKILKLIVKMFTKPIGNKKYFKKHN